MKDLNIFLKEAQETQAEILHGEVGQILRPFGSVRKGFDKKFDFDKVDELMSREGWEYVDAEEDKSGKTYKWEKNDYQCHLYVDELKNRITNFNIFN